MSKIEECINKKNYDDAIKLIQKELACDLKNPLMYRCLARVYEEKSEYNKAYLYYEQACFYAKGTDQASEFNESFLQYLNRHRDEIKVNPLAIVILTYNQLEYTIQCIQSIRDTLPCDNVEIIIVDNHSSDQTVEWIKSQPDIISIFNEENIGFPKGCNQGMRIANPNADILLLNNDTILMENSILNLRIGLYESDSVGCTGSTSNMVAGRQKITEEYETVEEYHIYALNNNIPGSDRYLDYTGVKGFCMMIKRSAVTAVGELDEQFSPGNCEDNDYSWRITRAGFHIYICKNSFTFHYGSRSFRLMGQEYMELLKENQKKFNKKWNLD